MNDPFWRMPNRFLAALQRREINHRQFMVGAFIAGSIDYRTGEVALTLTALKEGLGWQPTGQTLRNDLKVLRPAWIDYTSKQGQTGPYVFRLTGLQVGGGSEVPETGFGPDFKTTGGELFEVTSNEEEPEQPAPPQPLPDSAPAQLHKEARPNTRQDKTTNRIEENYDHDVAKTTTTDPATTDRLLERLQRLNDTSGGRAPGGGSSNGAGEGEQAVLAEAEALVVEGEAEWVEPPPPLCNYSTHRGREWWNDSGCLVCGVCHPPVDPSRLLGGTP